ncbi:sulfotransferase [Aestuariibius insulae]|uniref:sulfotransferase n=1 Tax=Aestuariibius insulae TaxID=2058287 RepID=UPI00345E9D22
MSDCIVITGAGRSGTSLVSGLLAKAGMRLSDDLIEASVQNPRGSFEDREIFLLQREMLAQVGPLRLPPPENWMDNPAVSKAEPLLRELLRKGVAGEDTEPDKGLKPWGFKSPDTAYTFRLWHRIFNAEKVVPKIVLCIREPSAVVTSLMRQYNWDAGTAELFWLTKYLSAIIDTGANVFFARYEHILRADMDHINALCEFTGLEGGLNRNAVDELLEPTLNRSGTNGYTCSISAVEQMWDVLKSAVSTEFDREILLKKALEINDLIAPLRVWLNEAYRIHQQQVSSVASNTKDTDMPLRKALEESESTLDATRKEFKSSVLQNVELERKIVLATEEIERLRVFSAAADQKRKESVSKAEDLRHELAGARLLRRKVQEPREKSNDITHKANKAAMRRLKTEVATLKDDVIETRSSTSFQLGHIFIRAIKRPGRNTIAAPWRILKLSLAQRSRRAQ